MRLAALIAAPARCEQQGLVAAQEPGTPCSSCSSPSMALSPAAIRRWLHVETPLGSHQTVRPQSDASSTGICRAGREQSAAALWRTAAMAWGSCLGVPIAAV